MITIVVSARATKKINHSANKGDKNNNEDNGEKD